MFRVDACEASKIVPPIMLSKAAIMLRVVSERGLLRTPNVLQGQRETLHLVLLF